LTAALHRSDVAMGARDSIALGLALAPIAFSFGYLAGGEEIGLEWWHAGLMSTVVYAGPSQFLAMTLILFGAGIPAIVGTTALANARYFLFAAALAPHLRDAPPGRLVPLAHGVADGSFALTMQFAALHPERPRKDRYLLGSFAVSIAVWVPFTVAGTLAGYALPDLVSYGLDFAAPAIFIGFLVPLLRGRVELFVAVLGGAGTVLGNEVLPAGAGPALAIVVAALLGGFLQWRRTPSSS
jgi:predicted branched-subunit amino acid permease